MTRTSLFACLVLVVIGMAPAAHAHAGQQSFVLLLPTGAYITAGVATVALTLLVISLVAPTTAQRLFHTHALTRTRRPRLPLLTSTLSFVFLCAVLLAGHFGATDPTRNPVPAYLWTLIWTIATLLHGITGTLWRYISPWTGPLAIMRTLGLRPSLPLTLPHWPALLSFLALGYLLLVSPRANDPHTLITCICAYWFIHFLGGLLFGPKWLIRAEAITLLMHCFGQLAPIRAHRGRRRIGLPGWALLQMRPTTAHATFMIALLAIGSFDGLYRTFTWFSWTGQNPLEFGGRSTVIGWSSLGLLAAIPALTAIYTACLWLGLALIGQTAHTASAFRAFAPALLPIAFAYHFAHYLPALLVEAQALPIIANDPLGTGANLLGLDHLQVTTGLFNRLDTVRTIWLAQAGAVVLGHMIAILLGHVIALRHTQTHRNAALSQLPIATLMILYTLFGLWLLASPQGA